MKKLNNLSDLFTEQLRELYGMEKQQAEALPKLVMKAETPALVTILETHIRQTKEQIQRLEHIFGLLDEKPRALSCKAMEALLDRADKITQKAGEKYVADAALVLALQCINHFEIANYGTVAAFSEVLGKREVTLLLEKTVQEEKASDKELSRLATESINEKARDMVSLPD